MILGFQTDLGPVDESQLVWTGVAIVIGLLLRFVAVRGVLGRIDDTETKFKTRKSISYTVGGLLLVTIAWIWIPSFGSVATLIGLVAAGTTIALAPVIINFVGWTFIILRRPFRIGDRIELAGIQGDVIDTRLQRFTVLEVGNWVAADQSTGRVVHIPNGKVFTETLANYSAGFEYVWHEIPVRVPFDSNWKLAEKLVREVLAELDDPKDTAAMRAQLEQGEYFIRYRELRPTVYVDVHESGVLLTARLIVPARERRIVEDKFWRGLLSLFAEHDDVLIAYNTLRTLPSRRGDGLSDSGV